MHGSQLFAHSEGSNHSLNGESAVTQKTCLPFPRGLKCSTSNVRDSVNAKTSTCSSDLSLIKYIHLQCIVLYVINVGLPDNNEILITIIFSKW